MSDTRTAERRNIEENAGEVPEMVLCPALEQQKQDILGKMLNKCRRRYHVRHLFSRNGLYWEKCWRSAGGGIMSGIRTAETGYSGENAEEVPEMVVSPALDQQ